MALQVNDTERFDFKFQINFAIVKKQKPKRVHTFIFTLVVNENQLYDFKRSVLTAIIVELWKCNIYISYYISISRYISREYVKITMDWTRHEPDAQH